ncbi:hypothetical protein LshimejAT787_0702270 [Lyophyllum shimeji]|uniref:Uncharacterized protein n=1 Tax=Lyophyllum shimeji TaxID=47721 RepID=A0A9P3UNV6_LYOSH|nr:hypothetical protein LshimejAT787_0702270 [Lyophyllum shimeji]
MLRCPELSKLSKLSKVAPRAKSVNFRRQTPGSVVQVLRPFKFLSNVLDPTHPAASTPKNRFPVFETDALTIRAFPLALLTPPDRAWTPPLSRPIDTWKERVERFLSANVAARAPDEEEGLSFEPMKLHCSKKDRVPMSFVNVTSKKRTSNKRHIRHKIASRLKIAINLIVSRGADAVEDRGKRRLVMNEREAETMTDKWVSPGWTYIFVPTLEIYRMPYHDLIPMLRKALRQIWDQSQRLEMSWQTQTTNAPVKHNARKPKSGGHLDQRRAPASRRTFSTTSCISAEEKCVHELRSSDDSLLPSKEPELRNTEAKTDQRAFRETVEVGEAARPQEIMTPRTPVGSPSRMVPGLRDEREVYESRIHEAAEVHDDQPVHGTEKYTRGATPPDGAPTKPLVLAGVEFKVPNAIPPGHRSGSGALEEGDDTLPSKPLPLVGAELRRLLKSERDHATTWFGLAELLQDNKRKRHRERRRGLRKKGSRRDLPASQFLDLGVPRASHYDPFGDDELRHERTTPQAQQIGPTHTSSSPQPASDLLHGPATAQPRFNNSLDAFDPFPEAEPVQLRPETKSSAMSIPDFDPFPEVTSTSKPLSGSPSSKASSPPYPDESPVTTPPAAAPSPSGGAPEAVSLPSFDPSAPAADVAGEGSARPSGDAGAPQTKSVEEPHRDLVRRLYTSEPVILPWRTARRRR